MCNKTKANVMTMNDDASKCSKKLRVHRVRTQIHISNKQ